MHPFKFGGSWNPNVDSFFPNFDLEKSVAEVAGTDVTVLLQGESGVGKGVVAAEIHRRSKRGAHRLLKVNCAAMPETLLESEWFGYEKGAFTGADCRRQGKFDAAQGGTVLLDEIGDLPYALQAKLLHVLQERIFMPLGSTKEYVADIRILASTNRKLEELVGRGLFREDLFYRLNVVAIHVPPLRERREEIIPLAQQFLAQYSLEYGRPVSSKLTSRAQKVLMLYPWPGNIRELENTIKRIIIFNNEEKVIQELLTRQAHSGDLLPSGFRHPSVPGAPALHMGLKEIGKHAARQAERQAILQVLAETSWNRWKAAQILKISYKALLYKMQDCGVDLRLQGEEASPLAGEVLPFKQA